MPKNIKKGGENFIKESPEKSRMVDRKIELIEENGRKAEQKEIFSRQEEELIEEGLRREINMMDLDENLRKEAESKARKIHVLGEKEKIEHLLKIAKEKGVIFAIKVAKEMNDSYILDTFHDILAREGYFQKFIK